MIREYDGVRPEIDPAAYVHETAEVIGKVKIGAQSSLWPYVVLRGDVEGIVIGEGTNIQDNTVIHTDFGIPTSLGDWISVGHSVVLHGCRVGNHCLVGIGSIVLNNAVLEDEVFVAAGALVPPGMRVPARHMAMGIPAKVRPLKPEEIRHIHRNAEAYIGLLEKHRATSRPVPRP